MLNLNFNRTYTTYDSFSQRETTFGRRTVALFIGGVYGNFNLYNKFYIQPELLYSQQYNIVENSGENWLFLQEAKVDYLNIPMLVQYELVEGLRVAAGPQVGFPLHSPDADNGFFDMGETLRVADFGAVGGIRYQLPGIGLGVFARYTHGLSNMAQEGQGKAKNRLCSFGLSYAVSTLWQ